MAAGAGAAATDGARLYKFGHNMFGLAFLFGVVLWQGWRVFPRGCPTLSHRCTGSTPS